MKKKKRHEQPKSEPQFFMMVKNGFVQRMEIEGELSWITALSLEDINRFIKHIDAWDDGIRGSLIGSVPGETLDGHIELALKEGCTKFLNVYWEDGKPLFRQYAG